MAGAKTTADDLQWRQQGAQEVIMTAQLPLNRPDAALVADGVSLERLRPLRMLGRSSSNTRVLLVRARSHQHTRAARIPQACSSMAEAQSVLLRAKLDPVCHSGCAAHFTKASEFCRHAIARAGFTWLSRC